MKKRPTPLGVHGLTLRSRDPEALAKECGALLGWAVLRRGKNELVLGAGPELFIAIRRAARGEAEGVGEVHLAVKGIANSRRRLASDDLGGDSWTRPLAEGLALTMREFQRAPAARWRKKRKKI